MITSRRVALMFTLMVIGLLGLSPGAASAHPLGNFTTNTATQLVVGPRQLDVLYVVDMAEIPTLKIRQQLGAVTGAVPDTVANSWRDTQCETLRSGLTIQRDGVSMALAATQATVLFKPGQAGLTTLRLECNFRSESTLVPSVRSTIEVVDTNFADRLGWREITASGAGMQLQGSIATESPTNLLRSYSAGAVSAPLHQKDVTFTAQPGSNATGKSSTAVPSTPVVANRGNDGLTNRFQSLVARRQITLPFALGAMMLAVVLGGFHAMAPGHGKTIMAAYAVSRRGGKGDIMSIGATVALTHTVGIMVLGALVSATSVVSPDRTLRWASVLSGVLVIGVGVTLVRGRVRAALHTRRANKADHQRTDHQHTDHQHDHDHPNDHDHPHDHDRPHQHEHPHQHDHPHEDGVVTKGHPTDERFIVTSHAHGGWQHDHVLPAPGALVRRRELIAMGLAGGMVPSPSALVVLLAAIALGRVPFGLGLVFAYGVGLAGTLIAAGLLLVRFETRVRRWTSNRNSPLGARLVVAVNALPIVSGVAIVGAGLLLVVRSVAKL